ncbi:hypothetical protein BD410DRAFT_840739 [Rickenella mellea]|uniref:Uncharacterized protein n=1 Tax=Rickenella mellea TaxID=50990 RepID=A0A4Y7Q358_9AGAM|nr:hypothetical protein BD410DRAFT_840739 [Rickenella mellea]
MSQKENEGPGQPASRQGRPAPLATIFFSHPAQPSAAQLKDASKKPLYHYQTRARSDLSSGDKKKKKAVTWKGAGSRWLASVQAAVADAVGDRPGEDDFLSQVPTVCLHTAYELDSQISVAARLPSCRRTKSQGQEMVEESDVVQLQPAGLLILTAPPADSSQLTKKPNKLGAGFSK